MSPELWSNIVMVLAGAAGVYVMNWLKNRFLPTQPTVPTPVVPVQPVNPVSPVLTPNQSMDMSMVLPFVIRLVDMIVQNRMSQTQTDSKPSSDTNHLPPKQ